MVIKSFVGGVLCCAALCGSNLLAEDQPAKPQPQRSQMMMPRNHMQFPQRNQHMMTAFLVKDEIKAYQQNPTPENMAALEKALDKAIKADTAKRKKHLEKELANLEKDQAQRAADLLQKVKSGEFKMPEMMRGNRERNRMRGKNVPAEK